MVELRSSGGAVEEYGNCLGVFQLLPDGAEKARKSSGFIKKRLFQLLPDGEEGGSLGPVYRQLRDGGNWQYYLYRWDIDCIHWSALHAANKYIVTPLQLSAN